MTALNEPQQEFERRLTGDLARLGGQAGRPPTSREVTVARHRRAGKRLAAAGSVAALLVGAALAGLWLGRGDAPSVGPGREVAVRPLDIGMDWQSRRVHIRRELGRLGIEGPIRIEKLPSGQVSFVTTANDRDIGDMEEGLVDLLRNFDAAWIEAGSGEMKIALTAGPRGGAPRRPGREGESR